MPTSVSAAPSWPRMHRRLASSRWPKSHWRLWRRTTGRFSRLRAPRSCARIGSPGHVGCALVRDGGLAGWGVIRPCHKGRKIGPLMADDRATAEGVLSALLASVGGGEIFLDVPSINRDAVALAKDLGLAPVFETARMYTGAIPPLLRLERVFGVTTFELGERPASDGDVVLSLLRNDRTAARQSSDVCLVPADILPHD